MSVLCPQLLFVLTLHSNDRQFAHIREALNVLSISKAMFLEVDTAQAFSHLNDLQILHLLVNFQPDEYAAPSCTFHPGVIEA